MNPINIIDKYYTPGSKAHKIMVTHGKCVADKALKTAIKVAHLNPDLTFIQEAAMLHDIAIFMTDVPEIGCNGSHPYVVHGLLGRTLLEEKGLPKHAMVCERHVGVGISESDIRSRNLPLPIREMVPVSIEEKIICYADKFFSKNPNHIEEEKSVQDIIIGLENYGPNQVERFKSWIDFFL